MTPVSLRTAVIQALSAAGLKGMSTEDLIKAVVEIRGVPLHARNTLASAISDINITKLGVITSEKRHLSRHYTLHAMLRQLPTEGQPTVGYVPPTFQQTQLPPAPQSITAAICGDPAPGRSALDQQLAGAR